MEWVKKEPRKVTKTDIQNYIDRIINQGASSSTVNSYINSLKFLMQEILSKRILLKIKYAKKPKKLPTVLSKEEINLLINAIENPTHKLIIELMYSAGLRLSELCNLKTKDIEPERGIGWVRAGKGQKDRLFIIASRIKEKLNQHIVINLLHKDDFLFKGRKGRAIHPRTPQKIVKDAAKKAGLLKDIHCHTLRHSFATHLIENGQAVMDVQYILGHTNSRTTMVYVHTASTRINNITSPYDML